MKHNFFWVRIWLVIQTGRHRDTAMRKEIDDGNHLAEQERSDNDQYIYLRAGTSAAGAGTAGRDCQDTEKGSAWLACGPFPYEHRWDARRELRPVREPRGTGGGDCKDLLRARDDSVGGRDTGDCRAGLA